MDNNVTKQSGWFWGSDGLFHNLDGTTMSPDRFTSVFNGAFIASDGTIKYLDEVMGGGGGGGGTSDYGALSNKPRINGEILNGDKTSAQLGIHEIPSGGAQNQVLAKTSASNYAVAWQDMGLDEVLAIDPISDKTITLRDTTSGTKTANVNPQQVAITSDDGAGNQSASGLTSAQLTLLKTDGTNTDTFAVNVGNHSVTGSAAMRTAFQTWLDIQNAPVQKNYALVGTADLPAIDLSKEIALVDLGTISTNMIIGTSALTNNGILYITWNANDTSARVTLGSVTYGGGDTSQHTCIIQKMGSTVTWKEVPAQIQATLTATIAAGAALAPTFNLSAVVPLIRVALNGATGGFGTSNIFGRGSAFIHATALGGDTVFTLAGTAYNIPGGRSALFWIGNPATQASFVSQKLTPDTTQVQSVTEITNTNNAISIPTTDLGKIVPHFYATVQLTSAPTISITGVGSTRGGFFISISANARYSASIGSTVFYVEQGRRLYFISNLASASSWTVVCLNPPAIDTSTFAHLFDASVANWDTLQTIKDVGQFPVSLYYNQNTSTVEMDVYASTLSLSTTPVPFSNTIVLFANGIYEIGFYNSECYFGQRVGGAAGVGAFDATSVKISEILTSPDALQTIQQTVDITAAGDIVSITSSDASQQFICGNVEVPAYSTVTMDLDDVYHSTAKLIDFNSHRNNTSMHVGAADRIKWNGQYTKPSTGIPATDLDSTLQTLVTDTTAHLASTANPHQVTLQQAATQQSTTDVTMTARMYLSTVAADNKILTASEIAALYASGVKYKGYLKYGADTIADRDSISAASPTFDVHNLSVNDVCGVHETQKSYTYIEDTTNPGTYIWQENAQGTDQVGDMYLIEYYYGTVDAVTYHGEVQAEIICSAITPSVVFDRYLDLTILLDDSVTDDKIGTRTLLDNTVVGHVSLVPAALKYTAQLQSIRDNLKAALSFQNTMDKADAEYVEVSKNVRDLSEAPRWVTAFNVTSTGAGTLGGFTYRFQPMYADGTVDAATGDYIYCEFSCSGGRLRFVDGTTRPVVTTNITSSPPPTPVTITAPMPFALPTLTDGRRWKMTYIGPSSSDWNAITQFWTFTGYDEIPVSRKANKVVLPPSQQSIYDFLHSPDGSVAQTHETDTFTSTLTEAVLNAATTNLWPSNASNTGYLEFRSNTGRSLVGITNNSPTSTSARYEVWFRTYQPNGMSNTTTLAYRYYKSSYDSAWHITNVTGASFVTGETYVNTSSCFNVASVQSLSNTWKELDIWKCFDRDLGSEVVLDLSDVRTELNQQIQEVAQSVDDIDGTFAHIIDNPPVTETVAAFLNTALDTTISFSATDKFTTNFDQADILEMATFLWVTSQGSKNLAFTSVSGYWQLCFELRRESNDQVNFRIFLYERKPDGTTATNYIYQAVIASPADPAAISGETITNITNHNWYAPNSHINNASTFLLVNVSASYLEIKALNVWAHVTAERLAVVMDLEDVYDKIVDGVGRLSADITLKADKIVQESMNGMTVADYFAKPRPTVYELPAGIVWSSNLTQADIAQLTTLNPSLGTRESASLRWNSVSGDFYIYILLSRSNRAEITLNQKRPDGYFETTTIYSGNRDGSGTINQLANVPQIDYLQFINYNQAFTYNAYVTLDVEDIRALSFWSKISFGVTQTSTKNLSDVRDDFLGEVTALHNNMSDITVDGIEQIDDNIQVHQQITDAELQALVADPTLAQPGVIYQVPSSTYQTVGYVTPDYSRPESTNRITSGSWTAAANRWNSTTWVVDRPGYVTLALGFNASVSTLWGGMFIVINNREISVAHLSLTTAGYLNIFTQTVAVAKGDVVEIRAYFENDPGTPSRLYCYFIPPKVSLLVQPTIVDYTVTADYQVGVERAVLKSDGTPLLWVDGKPIYEQTLIGNKAQGSTSGVLGTIANFGRLADSIRQFVYSPTIEHSAWYDRFLVAVAVTGSVGWTITDHAYDAAAEISVIIRYTKI